MKKILLCFLVLVLTAIIFWYFQQYDNTQITLKKIFRNDRSLNDKFTRDKTVILLAAGDTSFARMINHRSVTELREFTWPVEKVASVFNKSDIGFINLETPLIDDCPSGIVTGKILCADERHIQSLIAAKINVVNLANNHIDDYPGSAKKTMRILERNKIGIAGKKQPAKITLKGTKFAFLGFDDSGFHEQSNSDLVLAADYKQVEDSIRNAKKNNDLVIVSFHWGQEFTKTVTSEQKRLARLAVDAGADLIIGTHPHWIQPLEIYKNKLIFYSLGNFIFTQNTEKKMNEGLVARLVFNNKDLVDVELLPVFLNEEGQPEFTGTQEKNKIVEELEKSSAADN